MGVLSLANSLENAHSIPDSALVASVEILGNAPIRRTCYSRSMCRGRGKITPRCLSLYSASTWREREALVSLEQCKVRSTAPDIPSMSLFAQHDA